MKLKDFLKKLLFKTGATKTVFKIEANKVRRYQTWGKRCFVKGDFCEPKSY